MGSEMCIRDSAYTITIAGADETGSTATEFNAINSATTVAIDATAVTGLASDDIEDIKTLLNDATDANQFANGSFENLATVVVADTSLSGSDLADAIDDANSLTGTTDTVFTITAAGTITGSEANFTDLLDDETAEQISITNQDLTVNDGEISVTNANLLNGTTT